MNPMSLLTLPPSVLRDAALHESQGSPSGERGERLFAVLAVAILVMALIAAGWPA